MNVFARSLLILLCFTGMAEAQKKSSSSISLSATMYTPKTSPIAVLSWTNRNNDLLAAAAIQNVSSKPVRSVYFTYLAETPAACTIDSIARKPVMGNIGPFDLDLLPNHAKHIHSLGLRREYLLLLAASDGRNVIGVQVVPTRVVFSDGTKWEHALSRTKSYDKAAVERLASSCQASSTAARAEIDPTVNITSEVRNNLFAAAVYVPSGTLLKRAYYQDDGGRCEEDDDCGGGGGGNGPAPVWDDGGDDGGGSGGITPGPTCNNPGNFVCTPIANGCTATGCSQGQINSGQCSKSCQ